MPIAPKETKILLEQMLTPSGHVPLRQLPMLAMKLQEYCIHKASQTRSTLKKTNTRNRQGTEESMIQKKYRFTHDTALVTQKYLVTSCRFQLE